jgi:hypothetical protein
MPRNAGQPVTVRFAESLVRDLKGLAVLDGTTLADQVREAASRYVDERRADPDLQDKIRKAKEERIDTLSDLADMTM